MKEKISKKTFDLFLILIFFIVNTFFTFPEDFKTLSFQSDDGLEITADLYLSHDLKAPFVILFHQAGWSRGEYLEIIPKLNKLGFNCLAIDQRSGGKVNGVDNLTYKRAVAMDKSTTYLDALQDMAASLKFVRSNYSQGKLIIWGSSYSAALVIKLASENNNTVDGVLSFSPGEYFSKFGKSKTYITEAARNLFCPIFFTSARGEKSDWDQIYDAVPSKSKYSFLPETGGNHGSRALWEKFEDNKDYWAAVKSFLEKYFVNNQIKNQN